MYSNTGVQSPSAQLFFYSWSDSLTIDGTTSSHFFKPAESFMNISINNFHGAHKAASIFPTTFIVVSIGSPFNLNESKVGNEAAEGTSKTENDLKISLIKKYNGYQPVHEIETNENFFKHFSVLLFFKNRAVK